MGDSFFKRSFELTKLTVKVGLKELTSSNIKSRIDQAKMITETLSQLKGAAMKAGQMLSIELDDYFPPEAVQIMSQLQSSGSSVDYKIIEATLKKELGLDNFKKLTNISKSPIASASIAQIHTAFYKDKKVVLKVQHQGISKSINTDMALIKKVAQTFCTMTNRKMNLNPLFTEMKAVLNQEIDFEQEVTYLKKYKKNLERINTKSTQYYSPEAVTAMSTKKVITMSFEEGISINKWIQSNPSKIKKNKLAHLILNLYCHEFYHWGLVQTDPNFANFLVREENDDIGLVLLDFGATREYDQDFRSKYLELIQSVKDGVPEVVIDKTVEFGLMDRRESDETKALFIDLMNMVVEPFVSSDLKSKFNFSDQNYTLKTKEIAKNFISSLKYSPPPHKLLFLHRKLGGISSLLRRLEVDIELSPYWEIMFDKNA